MQNKHSTFLHAGDKQIKPSYCTRLLSTLNPQGETGGQVSVAIMNRRMPCMKAFALFSDLFLLDCFMMASLVLPCEHFLLFFYFKMIYLFLFYVYECFPARMDMDHIGV